MSLYRILYSDVRFDSKGSNNSLVISSHQAQPGSGHSKAATTSDARLPSAPSPISKHLQQQLSMSSGKEESKSWPGHVQHLSGFFDLPIHESCSFAVTWGGSCSAQRHSTLPQEHASQGSQPVSQEMLVFTWLALCLRSMFSDLRKGPQASVSTAAAQLASDSP